ncbi:MAG: PEGA domain-containing protein [Myxococcales bacterium]|nr:PEGA domain-containing protein [Myxococcales bacterium]
MTKSSKRNRMFLTENAGARWFTVATLIGSAVLGISLVGAPLTYAQEAGKSDEVAKPEEGADRAAERLNEEGKRLVAVQKYEEALDKFRASLKLFPLSNAIFNIGSMLYTLRQYEEAYSYLDYTLRAPLDPRQREIVLQYRENVLSQLKTTHGVIMVESSPPGAQIAVNNKALPFETPMKVLVPYGAADITVSALGFKPVTKVVNSSRADPPKDLRIRLERDDPDAQVTVFCPKGADVFIDGQMMGVEVVRMRLLVGPHIVRCGKTPDTKAFERDVLVKPAPNANAYEFSKNTN